MTIKDYLDKPIISIGDRVDLEGEVEFTLLNEYGYRDSYFFINKENATKIIEHLTKVFAI